MAKVFVVQENPRMDYSPAESFGEVVFMTADEYSPVSGSLRNEQILDDIYRHLSQFDPDSDWLLMTGNPIVMGYAFHLAFQKAGSLMCLQWDRQRMEYREVSFNP